jgi:type IX secretion system PorP/SprF family membrane protein
MYKKATVILIFISYSVISFAQQDAQFSQYMFNHLFFNPGFAGTSEAICITGLYRQQWVGFKDVDGNKVAPETYTISLEGPLRILHGGLGATITNDKLGFEKNITVKIGYSYHLNTPSGLLGIGLMVGFLDKAIDFSKFKTVDDDPLLSQLGTERQMLADFSLGAYYKVPNQYYLGISASQLIQSASKPLAESQNTALKMQLKRHYYLTAGYQYTLPSNPSFELDPSVLFKTDFASAQFDISALLKYKERFWGGLSYRFEDAVVVILGMEYKNFEIGYSYDITTSTLGGNRSSGSHEIMAGYRFRLDVEKLRQSYKNTRFL